MAYESQLAQNLDHDLTQYLAKDQVSDGSVLRAEPRHARVNEEDYQSFSAALGSSARGRAFLQEYARRNRHADTEIVLEALFRLEKVAHSQKTEPEAARIRQDLRALLDTIRAARPQIDQSPGAIKAATLSALIEFMQARIEALVSPMGLPGAVSFLSPVPQAEQPELPMPHPGSSALRSIALVQPIAPPIGDDARPAPDPFVLALDPRVGPVFGQEPGYVQPAPPRATEIIPEINFIDTLFDRIDAKAAPQTEADDAAAAMVLAPPNVANANIPPVPAITPAVATSVTAAPAVLEAPPVVASLAAETRAVAVAMAAIAAAATPKPSRAILPPLDLQPFEQQTGELPPLEFEPLDFRSRDMKSSDLPSSDLQSIDLQRRDFQPLDLPAATQTGDEVVTVGEIVDLSDSVTNADATGRAVARTQATLATAAAIDDIVVAAKFALAEAAFVDTDAKTDFARVGFAETALTGGRVNKAPMTAAVASSAPAQNDTRNTAPHDMVRKDLAAFAVASVVADPSQQVWDSALAAIMALSDEERLALFT